MNGELFDGEREPWAFAPGALLLPRLVLPVESEVLDALRVVVAAAPFRHMVTPGGHSMSVAMTNCGEVGWVTDRKGYRYAPRDPETGRPWPPIPDAFAAVASQAAERGGYTGFAPDACLVNRYAPGAKLSLHQDRDEADLSAPIVSVSLGLPATFLFGGERRSDPACRLLLEHADVVVWGGPSRLAFHGVQPVKDGEHPLLGRLRINLTFRKAR